jgi:hypothetical protein
MTAPATGTGSGPADDTGLLRTQLDALSEANARLREVAKWFVTSAAALGALLVGTSPLTGLAALGWSGEIRAPLAWGAVALGALAVVIFTTSRVLAPSTVDFVDVIGGGGSFAAFRKAVDKDPYTYLGAGSSGVADFAARRAREFKVLRNIDAALADPSTPDDQVTALEQERPTALANITRTGWIVERLRATAENRLLWQRFTLARVVAVIGAAVAAAGIVGFLVSVHSGASADDLTGPVPVRVALTESGSTHFGQALGPGCPTGSFDALLLSGGKTAPWEIMVVDARCARVDFTLDGQNGDVLFVPAP